MGNKFNLDTFFENKVITLPNSISPGDTGVRVEWKFNEGSGKDIERVVPSCGCTGSPEILEDRLVLYYDDNTDENDIKASGGAKIIRKSVTVYLKDGEPLRVPTNTGVTKINAYNRAGKDNVALAFEVMVK